MHLLSPWLLWAQSRLPGVPERWANALEWLFVLGEPGLTDNGLGAQYGLGTLFGGLITWVKVVSIFALLGWVASWVVAAYKTRTKSQADVLDIIALIALGGSLISVVLNVLQTLGRLRPVSVTLMGSSYALASVVAVTCGGLILIWIERALWISFVRLGKASDFLVGIGIHLAVALGFVVAYYYYGARAAVMTGSTTAIAVPLNVVASGGARLGATYMGFVVLVKLLWLLIPELLAIRPRRLLAVAQLSIVESTRKMWAPWVVIVIFVVILAFTHWFLPASTQRPAEMGRLFVGTLSLLCMLLLTVMVAVLAPLSLPQDIQAQTIYTIVSKPVRRLELIWGRMIGYMTIVTALILLFGVGSLWYLSRNVGRPIAEIEDQADKIRATDPDRAKFLTDQAEQLRSRMSARVPVKGSLTFIDSRGTPKPRGIDVGQELEFRSHIEGGTPSAAIWHYGIVPAPHEPKRALDRRIPVSSLLVAGTIEAIENDAIIYQYGVEAMEARSKAPDLPAAEGARIAADIPTTKAQIQKLRDESKKKKAEYAALIEKAKAEKIPQEADRLRREAALLHSPPIPMEMTFTIYRTTKGRVGDPVYAEIEVEGNPRAKLPKYRVTFPIREYYTNKQYLPSSYLVGSLGQITVTVHCMSPTQYLGMAESDFYLLADSGNFGTNFMKGLFGIWLQAMVLTAIGVFAGTFLSWPVALLFTIAFFVAGHAATSLLKDFVLQTIIGGGPFESLIRLIAHENQVNELAPTLGVVVAKTFDSILMPLMSRMVYLIPNLSALDVSNTVAEGFAVTWPLILGNAMAALAYALPFSIAGYFILKNREVAA
jgi:hypothetical protein